MAVGWSPAGGKGWWSLKGEFGYWMMSMRLPEKSAGKSEIITLMRVLAAGWLWKFQVAFCGRAGRQRGKVVWLCCRPCSCMTYSAVTCYYRTLKTAHLRLPRPQTSTACRKSSRCLHFFYGRQLLFLLECFLSIYPSLSITKRVSCVYRHS